MFNAAKRNPAAGRSQAVVAFQLNNIPNVVAIGAQGLFAAPGRFRSGDGVKTVDGRADWRLADELAANAYRPRVLDTGSERIPAGGFIFTDCALVVPSDHIRQDMAETGGQAFASELLSLAGLIDAKFGTRAWHRGRNARVVAIASDDLCDSVTVMFGLNIQLPGFADRPRARLRLGSGEELSEPMVLVAVPGHRGPGLIKMPAGAYPGQGRITVASSVTVSPFFVKVPGWDGKVVVDLDRGTALDAHGMTVPGEESDDGQRWMFPESGLIVEIAGPVAPKESPIRPAEIAKPEHPPAGLWARLCPGGKAKPERHEPRMAASIAPAREEPRLPLLREDPTVVCLARPRPPARPPVRPTVLESDDAATVVPMAKTVTQGAKYDPDRTIVLGGVWPVPRTDYVLERVGIGLLRVDLLPVDPPIPGWHVGIGQDGGITGSIADEVTLLGASAKDEHLYLRRPGAPKWRMVAYHDGMPQATLPADFRLLPSPIPDHYHALLLEPTPLQIRITDALPHVFGRSAGGEEVLGHLSFPPIAPGAFDDGTGNMASLDFLISRQHLTATFRHGQLHLAIQGKTPVWKLRPNFTVAERLDPGSSGELVLASEDMLLVGCAVVRFRV